MDLLIILIAIGSGMFMVASLLNYCAGCDDTWKHFLTVGIICFILVGLSWATTNYTSKLKPTVKKKIIITDRTEDIGYLIVFPKTYGIIETTTDYKWLVLKDTKSYEVIANWEGLIK